INLGNKAVVHREIGELDVALKIHEERLEYYERRGFKNLVWNALWNIASIYQAKGLFNKAHEHFKEALQIHDDLGNKSRGVFTLYSLVLLGVEFDKIELAKEYYVELERRSEDVEYKITKNQVLQAEAAILARSLVARDRIRAEVIYEQLLNEQLDYAIYLGIIFHLCELLLSELKASSDERILAKLQKYVDKMIELSTKNYFTLLIVESLWFKAQLSLLNLDFEKTRELLTQALNIAEEKGLNRLSLKIMKAKEQLVQQLVDLEDLEKESPTISKRMDTIKIENGFKEITSSQMYQFKQNI
ncbi:MAG: tetratricopeptide repeat protein, partial [Candidatus Heimdallarchaeota archaeon]|nr:tetratricopeptide repeat protein [Candidatus Heimdallarchaeota archaeon]